MSKLAPRCLETFEHKGNKYAFFSLNKLSERYGLFGVKDSIREVSSFRITRGTKEHFSHPVIHNGVLYQRRGDALMAFDISFS
jgi:hypothetical protein